MVVFNYSGAEINAKVVYYGPALSGKTTNLENIYQQMPSNSKGKMVSMKTRTDRTLFFDFLPLELGEINGYRTRILLYTVPGQVYYNATRKLVLKGADAVVFVADSDPAKMQENIDSLRNLEENLNEHGLTLDTIPWVIQYNKRDLGNALPVETLNAKLNLLNVPCFEATATTGQGIYETFQAIAGILYRQLVERLRNAQPAPGAASDPTRQSQDTPPEPPKESPLPESTPEKVHAAPPPPSKHGRPAKNVPPPPPPATKQASLPKSDPVGDQAVTDVLDTALREVDDEEKVQSVTTTSSPKKPVPAPQISPRPDSESDEPMDRDFQFASLEKPSDAEGDVGRIIDFEETQTSEEPDQPDGEFIVDPFQTGKASKPKKVDKRDTPPSPPAEPVPASPSLRGPRPAEPVPASPLSPPSPPAEPVTPSPSPPPLDDREDDSVTVTVPVSLKRSQIRKTVPIKIELEIEIGDEEF